MSYSLDNIQSYILNDKNIESYLKYKIPKCTENMTKDVNKNSDISKVASKENDINKENRKDVNKEKIRVFVPREQDSLFWCYYMIKNGEIEYEKLTNRNPVFTKQIKIDLIGTIRKNKQVLKTYKFDTLTNIESNLANDNNINIKTVLSLCAIDAINVVYINNKTYYEFLMNDTSDIYVIREIGNGYHKKYGFEAADHQMIETIRSTLFKLDKLDKPIKSASSYKLPELVEMANKLAIQLVNEKTGKKKTKNELYESLVQYF